ncbi:MAG: chemotaxis protein CheX [Deltaproteobacteria bacterium]|nr:chemotaxis protein CheX [Deltaproteobacteria bacterium]
MNPELIKPFLKATQKVLEAMANLPSTPGKPHFKKDRAARGDVSGVVGLAGDMEGSLSITFSETCICAIVSRMFGETMPEINAEVEDAVGEITNIISGDSRRELAEQGVVLQGAVPSVIVGKGHRIRHMSQVMPLAVPFSTEAGDFVIEVCLG